MCNKTVLEMIEESKNKYKLELKDCDQLKKEEPTNYKINAMSNYN